MIRLAKISGLIAALFLCMSPLPAFAATPATPAITTATTTMQPVGPSGLSPQAIGQLLERAESCVQSFFHAARLESAAGSPPDFGVLDSAILRFYSPHVDWQDAYWKFATTQAEPGDLYPYHVSIKSSLLLVTDQPNRVVVQFKVPAVAGVTSWDEHMETVTLVKKAQGWVIDEQTSSPLIDSFSEAEMQDYVTALYGAYIGAPLRFRYADNRDYVFSATNLQGQTVTFHANKRTGLVTQWK